MREGVATRQSKQPLTRIFSASRRTGQRLRGRRLGQSDSRWEVMHGFDDVSDVRV